MIVLTFNSGSSSLKFGLYRVEASEPELLITGENDGGELKAQDAEGSPLPGTPLRAEAPETMIQAIVSLLARPNLPATEAIGHRVVHGGLSLRAHCVIDDDVERKLEEATSLSPLHAPAALALIRLAKEAWPGVPQSACLDTAFHADMPDVARTLPVSPALRAEGVQRYGFHGLSCESILRQLNPNRPRRIVIAHLGSGASITAVRQGRSIDTSMGLTPSGGVIMATRSGNLDPGILIYLLREKGFDAARLEDLIDHESGMLGISGLSSDLRDLHKAETSKPDAGLAVAMFCLSVAKEIAGMIVALDGIDTLVFTGGIGEHDAAVRATIGRHLEWAGVRLDEGRNDVAVDRIDHPDSRCRVYVLPSREDEQIAWHTRKLVAQRH